MIIGLGYTTQSEYRLLLDGLIKKKNVLCPCALSTKNKFLIPKHQYIEIKRTEKRYAIDVLNESNIMIMLTR